MRLQFKQKITDREIDSLMDSIYFNYRSNPVDKYYFDFTNVEFVGNQELLVLSSLLKSFVDLGIQFEIEFFKKGIPTTHIPERVKKQIIQFWDVWKIWKIIPNMEYYKYFGIDGSSVEKLKESLKYYPKLPEIYSRYGITPFINLGFIHNYNEIEVQKIISPIYKLNGIIKQLLYENNCHHPFADNSLSTIITEELYLNFLDHSGQSSFGVTSSSAFMSISFQTKLDEEKYDYNEIQKMKRLNFESECLDESIDFFFDEKKNEFKNIPYLQFSFLDFGQGIASTLREQFVLNNPNCKSFNDSAVLRYAFKHNSSRHSIEDPQIDRLIPRGLFDTLTIAERYNGLLIVRSNYGKIIFDFSKKNDIENAFSLFGDDNHYFPGTLISLYIPAVSNYHQIKTSSIKPNVEFVKIKSSNVRYNSINSIINGVETGTSKEILYSNLLKKIRNEVCSHNECFLTFLDFENSDIIERRIIRKTLYFLLSDYEINYKNNIIVTNLSKEVIDEIDWEISCLNVAIKKYKIHPLPIITWASNLENIKLRWLGVYDKDDEKKLNQLLFDEYTIAKSDFADPDNLIGHLISFDNYGNLMSNLPTITRLKELFAKNDVEKLLYKYDCIKKDNGKDIYLCNGNYYQKEYVELANLISVKSDCDIIARYLYEKLSRSIDGNDQSYCFIGITTPSQKIINSLINQNLVKQENYILMDSYQTFDIELGSQKNIDGQKKYVLVCDAISTGYLAQRLDAALRVRGACLNYIVVIVDILDRSFSKTKNFLDNFEGNILSLFQYNIKKYTKNNILDVIFQRNIIRINPHTNLPIKLSVNETKYAESVIYKTEITYDIRTNNIIIRNKFIESIGEESVKIGYLKFNNLIHPYFFETRDILKDLDDNILKEVFAKINISDLYKKNVQIFYPRKSGIENINFLSLKNYILANQSIEEHDIERFGTVEGWRFPHTPEYLSNKIKEDTICLILDDGACSGDSITQMIDEISFYKNGRIVLICFIGRIHDHKREFFSRLYMLKNRENYVNVSVYFVTHWHIPTYYLDDNPTTKEIEWLNDIIGIQNTPHNIKKIAQNILKEISPKSVDDFTNYKYLPVGRTTNSIPKKELLLIREELGKVIGYRLYKESFLFFDSFFRKYENKKHGADRYKEIELLCALFIYEPYLYDKIILALPDIVQQIEEFVRILIFSNEKIYDKLTYKWEKKDIIHLFFIVFKNEKLTIELSAEKFLDLIAFTQPKESALNYVLYKLLSYFPVNIRQIHEKIYGVKIKELLGSVIRQKEGSIQLRQFFNFIQSLPTEDDINSHLEKLKENHVRLLGSKSHNQKNSFHHNVSLLIVTIRDNLKKGFFEEEQKTIIRRSWGKISKFILPILNFSSSHQGFLYPYPYYELVNQISSLREKFGFIENSFFSPKLFQDVLKLEQIMKFVAEIENDFSENTTFYDLVETPYSNMNELFGCMVSKIENYVKRYGQSVICHENYVNLNCNIKIPKLYANEIILEELVVNITKYAQIDENNSVTIECKQENKAIMIIVSNKKSNSITDNSNGEGQRCLKALSSFEPFGFQYNSEMRDTQFIQYLKFAYT